MLYILVLLLILHHKEGVIHKIVGLSVSLRIFFIVYVQRLVIEEMVIELLLQQLELVQRLVHSRVHLLISLLFLLLLLWYCTVG